MQSVQRARDTKRATFRERLGQNVYVAPIFCMFVVVKPPVVFHHGASNQISTMCQRAVISQILRIILTGGEKSRKEISGIGLRRLK